MGERENSSEKLPLNFYFVGSEKRNKIRKKNSAREKEWGERERRGEERGKSFTNSKRLKCAPNARI